MLSCRLHAADCLGDVETELVLGQPLPADGLLLALRRKVGDANLGLKGEKNKSVLNTDMSEQAELFLAHCCRRGPRFDLRSQQKFQWIVNF